MFWNWHKIAQFMPIYFLWNFRVHKKLKMEILLYSPWCFSSTVEPFTWESILAWAQELFWKMMLSWLKFSIDWGHWDLCGKSISRNFFYSVCYHIFLLVKLKFCYVSQLRSSRGCRQHGHDGSIIGFAMGPGSYQGFWRRPKSSYHFWRISWSCFCGLPYVESNESK